MTTTPMPEPSMVEVAGLERSCRSPMRSKAGLDGMLEPREMVQMNDPVTNPPRPSFAVMRVVYGLKSIAELLMVPAMVPVGEMDKPSGRPEAEKLRLSESGSLNDCAIESWMLFPAKSERSGSDETTGGLLLPPPLDACTISTLKSHLWLKGPEMTDVKGVLS